MEKLSVKQTKVAQYFADPTKKSVAEIAKLCGISTSTLYKWLKTPQFREYVQSIINTFSDGELSNVWKALIEKCLKGDVPAIKLFFELKSKYGDSSQSTSEVIQILDDIPKGESCD